MAKDRFISRGAHFLKIGIAHPKDTVALWQYPGGNFKFSYGNIEEVQRDIQVAYRMGTSCGSSGSPLLNVKCEALAMHKAGEVGVNNENTEMQPELRRYASSLTAIMNEYIKEHPENIQYT